MRRPNLFHLLLALLAAGCAMKGGRKESGQNPPVTFSHQVHSDMACLDCHAGVAQSESLGQRHLPPVSKCRECHENEAPPTREPADLHVTFSHAFHLTQVNDCKTCHLVLPEPKQTAPVVPPMSTCLKCHNHEEDFAQARCSPCHVDLKRYPLKPISAFAHRADFLRQHGALARNSAATCAQCHDQTYCAKCHAAGTEPLKPSIVFPEKVEADFIHRGDYLSRHQVDVQSDPASCRRCHGSAFCESCHKLQNVTPFSSSVRNPHPPGWAFPGAGSQFHGDAARQDIVNCAGCHDQGASAICVSCHRLGGVGGSPHPANWTSRHSTGDIGHNPMCQVCHNR